MPRGCWGVNKMKQMDTIIDCAFGLAKDCLREAIAERMRVSKEQGEIINKINSEYYCLTGKSLDQTLNDYVTHAVSEWQNIHEMYGERAGYKCVTLKLEEAKTKFTLEPAVVNYLDQKIEEFRKKI